MINYEEDWLASLLFKRDGSVALRAVVFAFPSGLFAVFMSHLEALVPGFREEWGLSDLKATQIWTACTAVTVVLLGFRTKQALARFWEGTSLLHQMRGEWFDTVSNCITFSISAKPEKTEEVNVFRHTMVRLMSLVHGSALEEIAANQVKLDVIDVFGLDHETLFHMKECAEDYHFNKVEVILHLVQTLITNAFDTGVLKIPPPILSRVYQTISRGFVNLLNAKKITDTRFPFPYAQLIAFLLFALSLLTPAIFSSIMENKICMFMITFVAVFGMFSVNFIAIQLENPFGLDSNDLPLFQFQAEMNGCLLMLLHPRTDMIPTLGHDCEFAFEDLYASFVEDQQNAMTSRKGNRLSQYHHGQEAKKTHWLNRLDSLNRVREHKADYGVPPRDSGVPPRDSGSAPGLSRSASPMSSSLGTSPQELEPGGTTAEAKDTAAPTEAVGCANGLVKPAAISAIAGSPMAEAETRPTSVNKRNAAARRSATGAVGRTPPLLEFAGYVPQANSLPGNEHPEAANGVVTTEQIYIRTTEEKPVIVAPDFTPLLHRRMEEFSRSMQDWVSAIEYQVEELNRNRHALSHFSSVLSSADPSKNRVQDGTDASSLVPVERLQAHCATVCLDDGSVTLDSRGPRLHAEGNASACKRRFST